MDIPLIAARAVHFAGALSLAGLFGFVALVAGPLPPSLRRRLVKLGWISAALALLALPFWLLFVAQGISGDSLQATIAGGALATMLTSTQFGHVSIGRAVLLVALLPCIPALGRRRARDIAATVIAAGWLAGIAWQGHAGADIGRDGAIHLAADTAHLVAAGLWLGALVPLALLLCDPASTSARVTAARRFSALGVACVAVLLVSGTVNAWYLVGTIPALIATPYGQVLLAKLIVVAAMLWLAAVNRWRLVPRLAAGGDSGTIARRLARHATIEAALGLGVIALVAALGTMIPAAHEALRWPFSYRLSLDGAAAPSLRAQIAATAALALSGLGVLIHGIWQRKAWAMIVGAALLFGLGWRPIQLLAVAATPTSYAVSPVPFAVPTLADGAALYRQQCVSCHGEEGEGDGPLAAELPIAPLDLAAPAVAAQPDGDLFWWLTAGMDRGVMPSFAGLATAQRWDLVLYLDAERQARAATSTLIAEVTAQPAPVAPDFALPAAQDGAATLTALRAQGAVLLIFATLPQSQARLDQLAQWHDALSRSGTSVVTIVDAPDIRDVYALYEHSPQLEDAAPAAHVEFLIDRNGYIRARWRPGDTPDWTQLPALEREVAAMTRMNLSPIAPTGHVHEG